MTISLDQFIARNAMAALMQERLFGCLRDPGRSQKGSYVDSTGKKKSQRLLSIRAGHFTGIAGGHLALMMWRRRSA